MSYEIKIADEVEKMLCTRIFKSKQYLIRRDGNLLPKDKGIERREQHLYFNTNQTSSARDIGHVDTIVLNSDNPKTVEMILEYEYTTNPKIMIGNFLAPFMADHHKANYNNDTNIYKLDSKKTLVFLLICLKEKHDVGGRGQAPLIKGENVRLWLLNTKDILQLHSKIFNGDVLIGDDLAIIVEKLYTSIINLRPETIAMN